MHLRGTVAAVLLFFFIPALAIPAETEGPHEPRSRETVPLRNWIPAAAAHPPEVEQGEISAMALPSAASHFIAVSPCRVVDTRRPDGAHGGPILTGGVSRPFNIPAGPCPGIPAASAYSLNIAVTGSGGSAAQFLTAWPAGTTRPVAATMNFNGGETVSNAALVPADDLGSVEIYVSTTSHVILDINGYVEEGVVTSLTPGAGLTGGGTGAVSVGIATGGVGAPQLGASAVTTGAIADGAVTSNKIPADQVVKSVNGLRDSVSIVGSGATSVSAVGSTVTVSSPFTSLPAGTIVFGPPGDTTLIGAGFSEIGSSTQERWREITTAGAPSARALHTAVWTGTHMIIWGGTTSVDATVRTNTGGRYDPLTNSWSPTTLTGAPSPRVANPAVWTGTEMIVWGGSDGLVLATGGGRYDPVGDSWTPTGEFGAPSGRVRAATVWTGSLMIIWGGQDLSGLLATGAEYNPVLNAWEATGTSGAPAPRNLHTAVWSGTEMVVWGGSGDFGDLNTGARYDPATNAWTTTSTTDAPAARNEHSAFWSGSRMIVWGGNAAGSDVNTGGLYDPTTDTWTATATHDAPAPAFAPGVLWAPELERLIVWGGFSPSVVLTTAHLFDPVTDQWTAIPASLAPLSPRWRHSVVWTGTRMLVWGGVDGTSLLDDGGQWELLTMYEKN